MERISILVRRVEFSLTPLIPLLPLLAIWVAGYAIYWFDLEKPYREFDAKELKAIPLLDDLNKNVLNELPPLPPETMNIQSYSDGIAYPQRFFHGRRLNIEAGTPRSAKYIENYYTSYLTSHGWRLINRSDPTVIPALGINEGDMSYSITFSRGTSCVEINTPPKFGIVIWQDFHHQSFTPSFPNSVYREIRESGTGKIATCP